MYEPAPTQNWSSERGGGNKHNRTRGYDQSRDGDRMDSKYDCGSYNSNSNGCSNLATRYRVEFNAADKSPESASSCGEGSYQDFQEYKFWKEDYGSTSRRSSNDGHIKDENDRKSCRLMFRG